LITFIELFIVSKTINLLQHARNELFLFHFSTQSVYIFVGNRSGDLSIGKVADLYAI
jgi:hypothetical protein